MAKHRRKPAAAAGAEPEAPAEAPEEEAPPVEKPPADEVAAAAAAAAALEASQTAATGGGDEAEAPPTAVLPDQAKSHWTPPYERIRAAFKRQCLADPILDGEKLPTKCSWHPGIFAEKALPSAATVWQDSSDLSHRGGTGVLLLNEIKYEAVNRNDKVETHGIELHEKRRVHTIKKGAIGFVNCPAIGPGDGSILVVIVAKIICVLYGSSVVNIYAVVQNAQSGNFVVVRTFERL